MQADGLVKLVSGRFLALTSHVVATVLLFFGKTPLVQIDLDTPQTMDQYEYTDTWMTTLLELALLLMALEFVGLFSGYTIHQKNANALSALAHLGGFLATLSMMLNGWTVRAYPYMFTLFSVVPACFDLLWWTFQMLARKLWPP
ncbi:unnamed protein product [Ectocarpus sp. 6 AP-2014]